MSSGRRSGVPSIAAWALSFALLTYAVLGMLSVGRFILPVAIVALTLSAWHFRAWPEAATGALLGVGGVLLAIGFLNLGTVPCPQSGTMTLAPGESWSCGGRDPVPWLVTGIVLAGTGILGYWAWRRGRPALTSEGPR